MPQLDARWADLEPPRSRSKQTSWTRCFNHTATVHHYTRAVYGTEESPANFDWARLDVVYFRLLKQLNMTCFLSDSQGVYRREILGSIFVDYPERTRIHNGAIINRGGLRLNLTLPTPIRRWPWVEVLHDAGYGVASQGVGNLWMYLARGSGLWFDPGRVLVLSDVWDLATFLNATNSYNPRVPTSKTLLMNIATVRLRGAVDSIAFTSHIDGGCCHRMVMSELVSLNNFTHRCPVSSGMRRGWPPHLHECKCTSSRHTLHSGVCGI